MSLLGEMCKMFVFKEQTVIHIKRREAIFAIAKFSL